MIFEQLHAGNIIGRATKEAFDIITLSTTDKQCKVTQFLEHLISAATGGDRRSEFILPAYNISFRIK